ncbi:TetR family transcriptional regulator [Alteromonas sp. ASW11-19]|uniref:TetR family transcriptional regulator n=1 Tax=Alteromonas salexigens TaxID=2982530 RepID=A0ABT2VP36_9ALTE|nr:TetR/AcrR family transcriptional regulator [Alteromonas salexigens]MCU7554233.1 TetR family transcriptional regulator [Alteromonas salexigens]
MSQKTKDAILHAAEVLFAGQGYAQTSLRMITARAGVNLASVNYHFGSKKNLIQAVLKQYFDVLMPQVDATLDALEPAQGSEGIGQVLTSLITPMLTLRSVQANGTELFVQLLGRGYNESQGHLRRFIMQDYGVTLRKLVAQIHSCLPEVGEEELFWRLHFAIGSFVFSMASSQALREIAEADYNRQVDIADVIKQLVPFVASGIAAEKKN